MTRQPGATGHGDPINTYGATDFAWKVYKTKARTSWLVVGSLPGQPPSKGTVTINYNIKPTTQNFRFRTPYPIMIVPLLPTAPSKRAGMLFAVCVLAAKTQEASDSMVWFPEVCQVATKDEAYVVMDALDSVAIGHRDLDSHSVGFWKDVAYRAMGVAAAEEAEAAGMADVDEVATASMVENIQRGIGAIRLQPILAQASQALEDVMGHISTLRPAPTPLPPPVPLPGTMRDVDGVQAGQLLAAGYSAGVAAGVAAANTSSGAGLVRLQPPTQGSLNYVIAKWVKEHRSPGVLAGTQAYLTESVTLGARAQVAGSPIYASIIHAAHTMDRQKFVNSTMGSQALVGIMGVTFGAQAAQPGPVPAGMQTRAQTTLPPPPAAAPLPQQPLSDFKASMAYMGMVDDPPDVYRTSEYYESVSTPPFWQGFPMPLPSEPQLDTLIGLPYSIRGRVPAGEMGPAPQQTKGVVKAIPYSDTFPDGAELHLPQQPDLDTTTFVGSVTDMFEG